MFLAHVLSPRALTGASLAPKLRLGNSAGLPDISEELIPAGKVYMRGPSSAKHTAVGREMGSVEVILFSAWAQKRPCRSYLSTELMLRFFT